MSTPVSGSQANSSAFSSNTALQAIANMRFIQDSVGPINNEIANGTQQVNLLTYPNCNVTNLMNYYQGLGYSIGFPNAVYGFFSYQNVPVSPTRIVISWSLPLNAPIPPVISNQTANYAMTQNNETVFADTTSGAFTVSFPSSPSDISGNGNNIDGSSNPLVLKVANSSATFIFITGYGWSLFPNP